jgi:hypothetical protein
LKEKQFMSKEEALMDESYMEGPVAFSIMFFGERRNDLELVLGNLFY